MTSLTKKLPGLSAAGTGLSLACAVHCLLASVLIALAPVIGSMSIFSESIEKMLIYASVIVAALVLIAGHSTHKRKEVFGLFVLAVALIFIGRSGAEGAFETIFVVAGAACLAASQFWNFRLSKNCCEPQAAT